MSPAFGAGPLCVDIFQAKSIQFTMDRIEGRVEAFFAFVVGRVANADELSLQIEQPAATAAFFRRTADFDVRRTVIAVEHVDRCGSSVGSLPLLQPIVATRSPRSNGRMRRRNWRQRLPGDSAEC